MNNKRNEETNGYNNRRRVKHNGYSIENTTRLRCVKRRQRIFANSFATSIQQNNGKGHIQMYIITNGRQYFQLVNTEQTLTSDVSKATIFKTQEKANNVLNSLKRTFKKFNLEVKGEEDYDEPQQAEMVVPVEINYDLLSKVSDIASFIEQIEQRRLYLNHLISQADKEVSDIEHAAEFYVLNASQGYKIYKLLHEVRVQRRAYKDELNKISYILGTGIKSENLHNVEKSIKGLANRKYTPRVNKQLFGV